VSDGILRDDLARFLQVGSRPEIATAWRIMGAQFQAKSVFLHDVALCISRSESAHRDNLQ
jgi:hypothetical protein